MHKIIIIILIFIVILIIYKKIDFYKKFPFKVYNYSKLTKKEFYSITSLQEPALFKNALNHNIHINDFCDKLSNKQMRTRYGNYTGLGGQITRKFKNITLGDLCKNINNSSQYGGNNIITLKEQLLSNIKLNNKNFDISRNGKLWIGPTNSSTPLHKDKPENLSLQVYGKKKWKFFNKNDNVNLCFNDNNNKLEWSNYSMADINTCPSAINAKLYEIVMTPGDMLYLPSQWAHEVNNETNSIMINFWY